MAIDIGNFSKKIVCSFCNFLTAQPSIATPVPVSSLWHKDVHFESYVVCLAVVSVEAKSLINFKDNKL